MSLTILLDMDGVLADFAGGVCRLQGRPVEGPSESGYKGFGFDSNNQMWQAIDVAGQEFWEHLEVLPWARDLTELCQKHGRTLICTSPSANPACAAGKMRWMQNYFSNRFFREFIITPRKEVCADPWTVLIDDRPDTCTKFRAAGGHAFLWPMPWNAEHREQGLSLGQVFYGLKQMLKLLNEVDDEISDHA